MPSIHKPLFRPEVFHARLAGFRLPDNAETFRPKLRQWADLIESGRADTFNERELLPNFLSDFFLGLLGYTGPAQGADRYTLSFEKHVQADGQFADAVIGNLRTENPEFLIALEGKGTKDPLDRPFGGRKMSAVDQGYRYAINLPCDWIVVTSMREVRLYFKGTDQYTCERFDVCRMASDDRLFARFVFLLGAERVVPAHGRSHFYELLEDSRAIGRELSREFYVLYADIRQDAFEHLRRVNPDIPAPTLLSCSQKLLDRILFCAFSEDRGLLPPETVRKAYEHSDPYNPRPIWENFRGLFRAINEGNPRLSIPKYNGGLFAHDPVLDERLVVPDDLCAYFHQLADYDYRPATDAAGGSRAIDVDILGHIFEQSLTDLEKLRNELAGLAEPVGPDRHKTRRKKEGAFYTPAFITRYLIEQTLGAVLRDRFEALRQWHEAEAGKRVKAVLADPNAYDVTTLDQRERATLVRFWEAWQDELGRVRIIDPACGSGAFLIEAFDQLSAAYQKSNERLEEIRGHRTLFDLNRQILLNNLFGVDLNEEAIEICRLSLWIKTAQRGKELTSLDGTIRVGNSLVADPAVDRRAFDWRAAFPEVFADGGFDVVVSNPPYIRQEWLTPYKPHWSNRFRTFNSVADIFTYFFELGVDILRDGGRLGFITSGSWVRGNYAGPMRRFLAERTRLESMIDFGEYQPFEDAEMIRPTIAVLSKQPPGERMALFKWLTKGTPPENLSDVISAAGRMRTDHLGEDTWELESDDVIALKAKMLGTGRRLTQYVNGQMYRGVLTGLNEVFVIDSNTRSSLIAADPRSEEIIKPFVQGQNLRPWFIENTDEYLIFTRRGIDINDYPAVLRYLQTHQQRLEPKPKGWSDSEGKWPGRKEGSYQWFEIQDSVDYWSGFEVDKIVWPDISKLPRFSMDTGRRYLGNTGYIIPLADYYLLGVLSSWATWFIISKTAQPLRLRGDRWQYRLIAQFMENIPIPNAPADTREAIADLARECNRLGQERYDVQERVRRRLASAFTPAGTASVQLNQKAQGWWNLTFLELGEALKTSFKLKSNPLKNPRTADEWEGYFTEKRDETNRLSNRLAIAETRLNELVFGLFDLTDDEIRLLEKEVEH